MLIAKFLGPYERTWWNHLKKGQVNSPENTFDLISEVRFSNGLDDHNSVGQLL